MTAFANSEIFESPLRVSVEIKSYNNKYLDTHLKIEENYRNIEEDVKRLVSERITRGRIEISIKINHKTKTIHNYEINTSKAKSYFETLNSLGQLLGIGIGRIDVNTILGAGDIIKPVEVHQDHDQMWIVVSKCLERALADIDNMKKEEGENIARDLSTRLGYVKKILKDIETKSHYLPKLYKEKLESRVLELTDNLVKIDPSRILHEVAVLATKSDITEEIVRSNSHIEQFKKIINENPPLGKKLNFLLQEFNREFNTMGSKVGNCDISYMVISVKSELEKIKEQVQNIE